MGIKFTRLTKKDLIFTAKGNNIDSIEYFVFKVTDGRFEDEYGDDHIFKNQYVMLNNKNEGLGPYPSLEELFEKFVNKTIEINEERVDMAQDVFEQIKYLSEIGRGL